MNLTEFRVDPLETKCTWFVEQSFLFVCVQIKPHKKASLACIIVIYINLYSFRRTQYNHSVSAQPGMTLGSGTNGAALEHMRISNKSYIYIVTRNYLGSLLVAMCVLAPSSRNWSLEQNVS